MDKRKAFTLLLILFQALIVGLTNIAAKGAATEIDPLRTGLIILTHPPATIFFSVILGFEILKWNLIADSIFIIIALWIAQRKSLNKIRSPEI